MCTKNTMRPPKRSVSRPSGRRISEPVRIGSATIRPNCASLRPSSSLMRMPMIENIVHTAKFTANDSVLMPSTEYCF
ncbi:hypothetical protein D3C78_1463040 [compost metagenome]